MGADQEADDSFDRWVAASQHALLRSAFLLTGDLGRAEDLVQDALVKVCLRWTRLRATNPDAYVRTVMYRTNISWWRSRRDSPVPTVRVPVPVAHDDATVRRLVVHGALGRLTDRQRAVLVLRYFDDLTETETAHVLGISVGSVKKHASLAKQQLLERAPELEEFVNRREQSP